MGRELSEVKVKEIEISKTTMKRLSSYLTILEEFESLGFENISSVQIAERMNLVPIVVKKDLSQVSSVAGKPKIGFSLPELINDVKKLLGHGNTTDAIIVGVGQLGTALLNYDGFKKFGINIIAGFDIISEKTQNKLSGKPVYEIDKMQNLVKRLDVKLGIITVPSQNGQLVAEDMVKAGIRAIWNFAPVHLKLPKDIIVKNEELAGSLAILSNQLTKNLSLI